MKRRAAAITIAATLAAGTAHAQDAGARGPFACKSVFVDGTALASVDDLLTSRAGDALTEILTARGLARAPRAADADLVLVLGLSNHVPATDDAGRLRAAQTVTLTGAVRGDGDEVTALSVPRIVATLGHFGAVPPTAAWAQANGAFLRGRVAEALDAFLRDHAAGARIQVDPPAARVAVGEGVPVVPPADGLVLGCRRDGETISITASLDGYTPLTQGVRTAIADTPQRLALTPVTPPAPVASVTPPQQPTGTGSTDSSNAAVIAALVAAALGGSLVAAKVLRDRFGVDVLPPNVPPAPKRLKVLFFAANPKGTAQLGLDEETREIRQKLTQGTYRDLIDFVPYWAARFDDVMEALNQHKPDVVHFSGHGAADGALLLAGDGGAAAPVDPELARRLFAAFSTGQDRIRLVVLNACYSAAQAEAIRGVVDCVIGSTREIADETAVDFAAAFYRAMSFGRSIRNAYDQGLLGAAANADASGDARDFGAPDDPTGTPPSKIVLLARDGVDPGAIFLVGDAAVGAPAPTG